MSQEHVNVTALRYLPKPNHQGLAFIHDQSHTYLVISAVLNTAGEYELAIGIPNLSDSFEWMITVPRARNRATLMDHFYSMVAAAEVLYGDFCHQIEVYDSED